MKERRPTAGDVRQMGGVIATLAYVGFFVGAFVVTDRHQANSDIKEKSQSQHFLLDEKTPIPNSTVVKPRNVGFVQPLEFRVDK